MNKQNLLIILIIASGSTLGGLAYGVSNGSIITGDLTVTGTCTGCGGEGSFTSYSLVLNQTIAGTFNGFGRNLDVGDDGSIIGLDSSGKYVLMKLDGTIVTVQSSNDNTAHGITGFASSSEKYKILYNSTGNGVQIYKSSALLQQLTNTAVWSGGTYTVTVIGISDNGKYIGILGPDIGGILDRIQIWQGS